MTSKIIFGEMVDYFRQQNSMTMEDLGNAMGKTKSTVSRWISGERYPKIEEVEKLAEIFSTDVETILFGANKPNFDIIDVYNQLEKSRQLKVYNYAERQLEEQKQVVEIHGQTAAGEPIEYGDTYIEEKEVSYVPNGAEVALIINGDSMEPDFPNGSIVFYKKQPQVENGQIAIVEVDGGVTCKRIKFDYENEKVILQSLNDEYEDQVFEDGEVEVLGLVVQ